MKLLSHVIPGGRRIKGTPESMTAGRKPWCLVTEADPESMVESARNVVNKSVLGTCGKLACGGTWIPAHSFRVTAPLKEMCRFCNKWSQAVRGGDDNREVLAALKTGE